MSFKRESDDRYSLDILRKRRVADLLAVDIPEDEALLTRSGKYACMVCPWRPIFDTLPMLSIHRDGKKHKHYDELKVEDKRQLEELKTKRRQLTGAEEIDAVGSTSSVAKAGSALLSAAPYVARVQRHKRKPYERRQVVSLESTSALSDVEREAVAAHMESIETPAQYRQLVSAVQQNAVPCQPYRGKCGDSSETEARLSLSVTEPRALSSRVRDSRQLSSHANFSAHYPAGSATKRCDAKRSDNSTLCVKTLSTGVCSSGSSANVTTLVRVTTASSAVRAAYLTAATKTVDANIKPVDSDSAHRYLQARGSGWIRSVDGSWHREEGVEFDSDDEPPALP